MENKKSISIPFLIITLIIGVGLYKQIDFQNFTVQKPALALLYFIVFSVSIYFIIKKYKNPTK